MHIRRAFGAPTAKSAIRVAKSVKKVDNVYSKLTNPVTLAQITNEYMHLGDLVTFHMLLPSCFVMWYHYVTTSKDMCESFVSFMLRVRSRGNGVELVTVMRALLLMYKLFWLLAEAQGMSKDGNPVCCAVDYLGYFMDTLPHVKL